MIGWGKKPQDSAQEQQLEGFDAFEMRLGDVMRGERATMGKSLLDVQRELKIKAAYIAAIENADPSAFDTPGFIAGYVRSYARYLNMDPDWCFRTFCGESGFATAHGMSEEASGKRVEPARTLDGDRDIFTASATPFTPEADPIFAGVEPRAVGSIAVLGALVFALAYGGWTVLQEVQRVQFAPVEETPIVASDIDPLAGGAAPQVVAQSDALIATPSVEAYDRVFRPQPLDAPVMIARDAPIATLDPRGTDGTLIPALTAPSNSTPATPTELAAADTDLLPGADVQVTEGPAPQVALLAVRPVWVRVRGADGSVIFEKVLDAGEEYALPASELPPTLRAGNSGSLFFKVAGQVYGPAGSGTTTAKNVALDAEALRGSYQVADLNADSALAKYVTVAEVQPVADMPLRPE